MGNLFALTGAFLAMFGWVPVINRENGAMEALLVVLFGSFLVLLGGNMTG